ncbi:lipopolysaccharide biosynthesis protein [Vibrio cyclitrophicus]
MKKVVQDSLVYTFGEVISKLVPFIMLPYLTRELEVDGYAGLIKYQVIFSLVIIFLGFNQGGALTRYYYNKGSRLLGGVILSGKIWTLSIYLIMLVFSVLFLEAYVVTAITCALFNELLTVQLSIRQCFKKSVEYSLLNIGQAVLSVVVTVFVFELFSPTAEGRYIAITLSYFFVYLISCWVLKTRYKMKYNVTIRKVKLSLAYIFSFGGPLLLHNISIFFKSQFDKLVVMSEFETSELGIYYISIQLASILSIIILSVNRAFVPYFYESLKTKKINYMIIRKWSLVSLFIIPLPALLSALIPESMFSLFLGAGFDNVHRILPILVLGVTAIAPYLIITTYSYYVGDTKIIGISSVISILTTVIYLIFISKNNLANIAYSQLISNILSYVIIVLYYNLKVDDNDNES